MKKGSIVSGSIERVEFPNKGYMNVDGEEIMVKNTLPGQKLEVMIHKKRHGKAEGRVLQILESSVDEIASACPHFGICGGCNYQNLPYEKQVEMKEKQVLNLLHHVKGWREERNYRWEGLHKSPMQFGYRNKMEFTFGDEYKGGPLSLGLHKRGAFHDIVPVRGCRLVDEDFHEILDRTLTYFQRVGASYFHRMKHTGFLRHLLVRKGIQTGDILVDLITTTPKNEEEKKQEEVWMKEWKECLLKGSFQGKLTGILHTYNDRLADVVADEGTNVLYGQSFFYEQLLNLKFKITPFSFFQTNSKGAEVLYQTVRDYIGETKDKVIYDLYSGTGTIAQILAPVAKQVVGVEIVEEAVEAARENAVLNQLDNCMFVTGDVLKVIDEVGAINQKPDMIVMDPPREGVHPKALEKIIDFNVDTIVYISCKPTSLVRDLEILMARGYEIKRGSCTDMFPGCVHVETVCLLSRK